MSVKSPGASLSSDIRAQAQNAWFAYRQMNPVSAKDPMTAGIALYQRGWRACFAASVEMAGLRPVLERWVELLETLRIEQDFEALDAGREGDE